MSSDFEQLLANAKNDNSAYYKQCLTYIVNSTEDLYYVARFLEPFLPHINDGNLNTFHVCLQNARQSVHTFPSAIHNVANSSIGNEKLRKVLDVLIQKYCS